MPKISDLFEISSGSNLALNALKQVEPGRGVPFVSRTEKNNGVSAYVATKKGAILSPSGAITVALGGSVLETFLQPEPFYTGRDIAVLTSKAYMSDEAKLFYCACIRANKYRFNYGRQANRTIGSLDLPVFTSQCSGLVDSVATNLQKPKGASTVKLDEREWHPFTLGELFTIKKGKRLTKADQEPGSTPFVSATSINNGVSTHISAAPIHTKGTISVPYNGSVGEAFYQDEDYWCSDDVNVLYPIGFELTREIGLFLSSVVRHEKYRFNYGRKWNLESMKSTAINLPATMVDGAPFPDFDFMTTYIQSLAFSSQI